MELVLRMAGLVEAEGRVAREHIVRVAVGLLLLAVAGTVLVLSLIAMGLAAVLGLAETMHPAWALVIVSFAYALVGLGVAAWGRSSLRR